MNLCIKPNQLNRNKALKDIMDIVAIAANDSFNFDILVAPINDDENGRPRVAIIISDVVMDGGALKVNE